MNIDSSPLKPIDCNGAIQLGSNLKTLPQNLDFMTLWTRNLYLEDIMRLFILGLGTIAWIQEYHLISIIREGFPFLKIGDVYMQEIYSYKNA